MPVNVPPQHNQSHLPAREQKTAVGHAVCASYFYSGMSDVALETGDEAMAEACKAIAFIFFSQRMLKLKKDSRYADALEQTLYNAMLSGISLSGDAFFYINPLEMNICKLERHKFGVLPVGKRAIIPQRAKTFNCFCCPPNVNRFLAKVDEYVYMEQEEGVYVNLFADSVWDNSHSRIEQRTQYPANGKVPFSCRGVKRLYVRIPHWCNTPKINCAYTVENGYAVFDKPAEITVDFQMQPKFYRANTRVRDNYGKAALMNGPVVYCVEGVDNGDIYSLTVDTSSEKRGCFQ